MNLLEYYKSMPDLFSCVKHPEKDIYIIRYLHLGINWAMSGALDARGIILDSEGNVIARPYKKFFNYKELSDREDLPEEVRKLSEWQDGRFMTYEKSDGSFIMVFYYDDEFVFTSSKTFDGEHVSKARELFFSQFSDDQIKAIKEEMINSKASFLFEMIGPSNIHVVEYPEDKLVLHDIIPLVEEDYDFMYANKFALSFGIDVVKSYDYGVKELLELQKEAKGIEGFVVKFQSGRMLKIKTEEYFENSKGIEFFFGRFFTKRKITSIVQSLIDDTYDDLVALAITHPRVSENIKEVKAFYDSLIETLTEHQNKWSDPIYMEIYGEINNRLCRLWELETYDGKYPKEIALDKSISPKDRNLIFLSRKDQDSWDRFLIGETLANFSKREG